MQITIIVISIILGLAVQYAIIKAAVVNGTQETYNSIDKYNFSQMRRAVKEGIIEAMKERDKKEGENQVLIALGNTIQEAIKAAAEQANHNL